MAVAAAMPVNRPRGSTILRRRPNSIGRRPMRITPSTALKQSRVTPRRGLLNLTNRIQPTAELGRATATMKTSRSRRLPALSRCRTSRPRKAATKLMSRGSTRHKLALMPAMTLKMSMRKKPRRGARRGTVVVVAVLGLAVLGTAGALGYRAMFGGSVIPSLPPIIAPGNKPIKIVPPQAGAPSQADAGPKGTGEHLVTHEEQPVNVQSANPVPRVVTTIPVISNAPDAPLPGGQPPAAPAGPAAPAAPAAPLPGSAQSNNPAQPLGATDQLTSPALPPSGSKPVRTVTIRADQPPAARPAAPAPAPAAHPVRVRQAATKPTKEAAPPPRTASAGPLSIVPTQEGGAPPPPPRTHTAMTRSSAPISSAPVSSAPRSSAPMSLTSSPAEAAPSGAGGYAVQVSSQRSEAEAQAAFRSLQAKYPQQLGESSRDCPPRRSRRQRAFTTARWSVRSLQPNRPPACAAA